MPKKEFFEHYVFFDDQEPATSMYKASRWIEKNGGGDVSIKKAETFVDGSKWTTLVTYETPYP